MQKLGYEAALCYTLSLMNLSAARRTAYAQSLAQRGIDVEAQDPRDTRAPRPPRTVSAAKWIRQNLYAKSWDSKVSSWKPLHIKSDAVSHGGSSLRTIHVLEQLKTFVELWRSTKVRPQWRSSIKGIGLAASQALKPGTIVAEAIKDAKTQSGAKCETMGVGGAWFGSASLVNSACAQCANALFRKRNGRLLVVIREPEDVDAEPGVKKGVEITVPYEQDSATGEMTCAVCGEQLNAERLDIG